MIMRPRDESLELISDKVSKEQLKKAITGGYSDTALSFMAGIKGEYVGKILDGNLSANTVNKLTDAIKNDKINYYDFFRISDYAPMSKQNEKYLDDFLDSIDKGVYHTTAAKIFAAVGYEEHSYNEALDFVKSGAFYPTDHAGLSVSEDVSRELDKIAIRSAPARALITATILTAPNAWRAHWNAARR